MEEIAETESEKSAEVEENMSPRRRTARRSSAAVSEENSVSACESTDVELSDGSSDESDDMSSMMNWIQTSKPIGKKK